MTPGRLIAVVGPSGVGKDSVMDGVSAAMPRLHLVRRVITRAPGLGGEDYDPVSVSEFESMSARGAFALHWEAHGLHYGIPARVSELVADGTDCLVNFSRRALAQAAGIFPAFVVLNITATPETLARRLAGRGRETPQDIARRLQEADKPLPDGIRVHHLANDGPLAGTVARAVALLAGKGVA